MRKKTSILIILFMIGQLFLPGKLIAAPFIDDTFLNTNLIDIAKTNANIDVVNGWVTLAKRNISNSILLNKDNYNVILINNGAVQTYVSNGSGMSLDIGHSITGGLSEPISIAGKQDEYILLDRGTKTACWYHYDGNGMVQNGTLSISMLNDPRAIAVMTDAYDFALLDQSDLNWYNFDGVGMVKNSFLSLNTGSTSNPISLSLEDNNYACVVLDKAKKEVRYYYYDGSSMILDSTKSIQTPGVLVNPKSISVSEDGGLYLIVDGNAVRAFNYDGSSMVYNSYISISGLINPLAVTIKPDSFDYAVLDEDMAGNPVLKYFGYDGSAMAEIPALRIIGLDKILYANDQVLVGKSIAVTQPVTGLKLVANVDLPVGTSISWEVTVDGITWKPITLGGASVKFASGGTSPNYRALLHTDNPAVTPTIFDVQLIDASLSVTGYSDKSSYKAGEAMIITAETEGAAASVEAIMWWSGGNGFSPNDSTELVPELPVASDLNTWHSRHNYPVDYDQVVIIPYDMPDGDYNVIVRAHSGTRSVEAVIPIHVEDSQYKSLKTVILNQGYE